VLGETFSEKPELVKGRQVRANAGELASQSRKHHITLKFKINAIKGNSAETYVVGHEIKDSYFRRFVRRRNSKVQYTQQIKTRDGAKVKIKVVTVTARKLERKKETDIRNIMKKEVEQYCSSRMYNRLTLDLVFGNFTGKLLGSIKKVAPVKRIEIVKSELMGKPPESVAIAVNTWLGNNTILLRYQCSFQSRAKSDTHLDKQIQ